MTTTFPGETIKQKSTWAHCGILYPRARAYVPKYGEILKPVFVELWPLFDNYLAALSGDKFTDFPWRYTERSLVGYLTAAAMCAGNVAIEEYQCERRENRLGRSDWWMMEPKTKKELYLESKTLWLSAASSGWKLLDRNLKNAVKQLRSYHNPRGLPRLVCSFVRPYWPISKKKYDNRDERERWLFGEDRYPDKRYDYCAYYWLKDDRYDFATGYRDICPALLIYCRELS